MKAGDLVRIKLPSSKGLYIVVGRSSNIELENLSHDRCWELYGYWYCKTYSRWKMTTLDMLEKWVEIVNEE
jgi:hypothetical protein